MADTTALMRLAAFTKPWQELSNRRCIRLLRLYPSETASDLRCDLYEVNLEDLPPNGEWCYEALSYAWGDPTPCKNITCSGITVSVSYNLHQALQHLRLAHQHRWLWADGVCINQRNKQEKSCQVPLMREIYQRAHVLIWLGKDDTFKKDFVDFPEMLRLAATTHANAVDTDMQQDRLRYLFCANGKPTDLTEWLLEIALKPWFSRLWVRQEAALAIDRSFHIGRSCFDFEHLEDMMLLLDRYVYGNSETKQPCKALLEDVRFVKVPTRLFKARKMLPNRHPPLPQHDFWVVKQNCNGRYSNPRDVIYGVCGFFESPHRYAIDYNLSVNEVFHQFTMHCIQHYRDLTVFELLGNYRRQESHQPSDVRNKRERPSWVPDYSRDACTIYNYTRDPKHRTSFLGTKAAVFDSTYCSIRLKGLLVDSISTATKRILPSSGGEDRYWELQRKPDLEAALVEWEALASSLKTYPVEDSVWTAFVETMLRGRDQLGTYLTSASILQTIIPGFQMYGNISRDVLLRFAIPWYKKHCRGLLETPTSNCERESESPDAWADIFTKLAWFENSSKRMFITGKGYLGAGPSDMREGDVICIFHGGRIPFILRPVSNGPTKCFTVIGGVYIHGMMHGEVMYMPDLEAREIALL